MTGDHIFFTKIPPPQKFFPNEEKGDDLPLRVTSAAASQTVKPTKAGGPILACLKAVRTVHCAFRPLESVIFRQIRLKLEPEISHFINLCTLLRGISHFFVLNSSAEGL